jgi:hypothetical protein
VFRYRHFIKIARQGVQRETHLSAPGTAARQDDNPLSSSQRAQILLMPLHDMKKIALSTLLLICVGWLPAFAATRVDAKAWNKVQTYDVRTLAPQMGGHARELVTVKFTFRGKDIHHLKPNWYESSIWQPDPNGQKGFSHLRVMVAKRDLEAFKSITTDGGSNEEMTVYGRVLRDSDANFFFVELLGRNLVTDGSGNATISW